MSKKSSMTGKESKPWHPNRKHYRCSRRENLTVAPERGARKILKAATLPAATLPTCNRVLQRKKDDTQARRQQSLNSADYRKKKSSVMKDDGKSSLVMKDDRTSSVMQDDGSSSTEDERDDFKEAQQRNGDHQDRAGSRRRPRPRVPVLRKKNRKK